MIGTIQEETKGTMNNKIEGNTTIITIEVIKKTENTTMITRIAVTISNRSTKVVEGNISMTNIRMKSMGMTSTMINKDNTNLMKRIKS